MPQLGTWYTTIICTESELNFGNLLNAFKNKFIVLRHDLRHTIYDILGISVRGKDLKVVLNGPRYRLGVRACTRQNILLIGTR